MSPRSCGLIRHYFKNLCSFNGLEASRAYVIVYYLALCVDIGNLLNICFECSSRSSLGVADIVTRCLTLTANAAYSGHNILPPAKVILLN